MKQRVFSLSFLFLAVVLLSGASLPTQGVLFNLAPLPENLLPLSDKGVIGELIDSPVELLKGEPSYGSAPLYGSVVLGKSPDNRFAFSLAGGLLYFDFEQDGDLSNNQPLTALPAKGGLFRKTLLSFPPVLVWLNYKDNASQQYWLAITCDTENKTFSFVNLGYRSGTVIFLPPDKNLKVAIYDANLPNGTFNDYGKDYFLVDLNGDGEFDISKGSLEKVLLVKTLNIAGDVYAIEGYDSGEYIDIRQSPAEKQPSGTAAITYVTKLDNKNKTQSGEGEVVFSNGGFQVFCSRGPAAFRRGARCAVFVKNGELMLYDVYDRLWLARFTGEPLSSIAAAELTFFPSQFAVGFPFKQNLMTNQKEYRPAENVVVSMRLTGQAQEVYTYFASGPDADRSNSPFAENLPYLAIKDPAGNVVAEGDMIAKEPGNYQFTWQIPANIVIPAQGVLYNAVVSWDIGSFQGKVTNSVQFPIVKDAKLKTQRGK